MDNINFDNFKIMDLFYAIGAIIAGIYYGLKKFSRNSSSDVELAEKELIKILRDHVEQEKTNNKNNIKDIENLKNSIDELENEEDELKKKLRRYDDYVDKLKYFCSHLPDINGTVDEFERCTLCRGCFLHTIGRYDRRKVDLGYPTERRLINRRANKN
jgi:predicted nuclease with TOPRIM domain